jgi:hypothetical protein
MFYFIVIRFYRINGDKAQSEGYWYEGKTVEEAKYIAHLYGRKKALADGFAKHALEKIGKGQAEATGLIKRLPEGTEPFPGCPEGTSVTLNPSSKQRMDRIYYCRFKPGVAKKEHFKRVIDILDDMLYYTGNQETSVLDLGNLEVLKTVYLVKWDARYDWERKLRKQIKTIITDGLKNEDDKRYRFTGRVVTAIEEAKEEIKRSVYS